MNQSDSDISRDGSGDHEVESVRSFEGAVRTFAFHPPEFHPIPKNDELGGKDLLECTKVLKD